MSTTRKHSRLDPAQRREQMLDAANDLFAERGYEEVSVEDIARSAGVTRGLVHHYFGGRTEVYLALLERLDAIREEPLRPPEGRSARARVADSVSRWLDWTEANRTIYLGTIAPGEDIADPEVRRVVADLRGRAVALLATFHADIAQDSPRLRYALECWTGLNRAATRRWLRGEATREATQELLASTLEHVLRTFGAPPRPAHVSARPRALTRALDGRRPARDSPAASPRHRPINSETGAAEPLECLDASALWRIMTSVPPTASRRPDGTRVPQGQRRVCDFVVSRSAALFRVAYLIVGVSISWRRTSCRNRWRRRVSRGHGCATSRTPRPTPAG